MACWSAENATKAYLKTLNMDHRAKEPNAAEFISALAAGNNARQMVMACAGAANPSTLLALLAAAHQTHGRVICILRGIEELILSKKILGHKAQHIKFVIGDAKNLLLNHYQESDFLLVDCKIENHEEILKGFVQEGRRRSNGAVIVGFNAYSKGSWRLSNGKRTQFLPIGEGLLVTRINDNKAVISRNKTVIGDGNGGLRKKSRWVVKVDKCTGEEHVFRVRIPQGEVVEA